MFDRAVVKTLKQNNVTKACITVKSEDDVVVENLDTQEDVAEKQN